MPVSENVHCHAIETAMKTHTQVEIANHGKTKKGSLRQLDYSVTENPPFVFILLLALQQCITSISSTLSVCFVIYSAICETQDHLFFSRLISTSIFMCGVSQCLDVFFGIRLPMIQGSQASFLTPIIAMMELPKWRSPETLSPGNITTLLKENATAAASPDWAPRMNEVSGGLLLASAVHVAIGATGVIGFLIRFIGPLTIAPTISLIGLGLVPVIVASCEPHWGVALTTILALIVFSIFLGDVPIFLPFVDRKDRKCHLKRVHVFRMIPILLGVGVGWLLSFVLTSVGWMTNDPSSVGFAARTDARSSVVEKAQWMYLPYPFQFGTPTFSIAMFLGMTAASFATIIESIGSFAAVSKICEVKPAPSYVVNRALTVSGFASAFASVIGSAHACVSFSSTVAFVGITKVASRIVWAVAGMLLMIFGVCGKLGACLSTIPSPVIGGYMAVAMAMVVGVGISNLKHVNLQCSRNIMILGVSIMMGLIVPHYLHLKPQAVNVGIAEIDQVFAILLKTPMLIGGALAFLLDNTVPGTKADRGFVTNSTVSDDVTTNSEEVSPESDEVSGTNPINNENKGKATALDVHAIPYIDKLLTRLVCCRYIPISPSFMERPKSTTTNKAPRVQQEMDMCTIST